MSVKDAEVIDAIGIEDSTNTLVLLIIDPFTWSVQEYDHMKAIQAKINNYVRFIEAEGYKSRYPDSKPEGFRIELEFKFRYTENCRRFLEAGKKQLLERGIGLNYKVIE